MVKFLPSKYKSLGLCSNPGTEKVMKEERKKGERGRGVREKEREQARKGSAHVFLPIERTEGQEKLFGLGKRVKTGKM